MQATNMIHLLVDFASQIEFSRHQYIEKKDGQFSITAKKTNPEDLVYLIKKINSEKSSLDSKELKQFHKATQMIENHLQRKISGFFSWFIGKKDKDRMNDLIQTIRENAHIRKLPDSESLSDGEARLKFYEQLPQRLKVKEAAANDLKVIKQVSQKIWHAFRNDKEYQEHMTMFFEGEHFLFEEKDDADDFEFYEFLKRSELGAYYRGSSHYDHGTLNGKTGGPVPSQKDIDDGRVANPQFEIEGPQVKALLFGRVKLALDNELRPILAKTFDEVAKEARKKGQSDPAHSKKYTFMQTEWAPDAESFFSINYWKHRIFSFCLYAGRKTLGFEKPNVGPYGYGHGDPKATIISYHHLTSSKN